MRVALLFALLLLAAPRVLADPQALPHRHPWMGGGGSGGAAGSGSDGCAVPGCGGSGQPTESAMRFTGVTMRGVEIVP